VLFNVKFGEHLLALMFCILMGLQGTRVLK